MRDFACHLPILNKCFQKVLTFNTCAAWANHQPKLVVTGCMKVVGLS